MTKRRDDKSVIEASDRSRVIWYFIFIVYLAIVLFVLVDFTKPNVAYENTINLEVFKEIRRSINMLQTGSGRIWAIRNLFGNIGIFVPFGFIFPFITNRRLTSIKTALAAIVTVSGIEVYQWLSKTGIFDVDDFILNWTGVLIGWLLYKVVAAISTRARRRSDD